MKTTARFSQTFTLALICLFFLASCKNAYQVSGFEELTSDHSTVAVLPFEMIMLGKIPENLSEEDILTIEETESENFQVSFLNEILRSTTRQNRRLRVSLQPHATTMAKLRANNISIRDSWTIDPKEMAELLGVDAVVRARIEKTRYMSDLASFGIDAGINILTTATGGVFGPWAPNALTRSKEIYAAYSLLDTEGNQILWSVSCDVDADWRNQSNDIIDRLNRRSARRFPYRQ